MQRNRIKITKSVVDGLQKNQTVWDTEVRGFGVRRQVVDKVFVLKSSIGGSRRFFTIGTYGSPWTVEQARKEALGLLGSLISGKTVTGIRQRYTSDRVTISDLCDRYISEHAQRHKKQSSAHSDQRNIENHIRPLLGKIHVIAVSKLDIEHFRDAVHIGATAPVDPIKQKKANRGGKIVTGGSGVANRCLTLLSKMFNLAEEWNLRPPQTNPVRRVIRFKEYARQRYLFADELRNIGIALAKLENKSAVDPVAANAIRLLIYTGARKGEILSLEWSCVDLDGKRLLISDSKTGQKIIRLSKPAIQILRAIPRISDSRFVFVGRHNNEKHIVNIQKTWKRICLEAGITGVRLHDLRHTYASVAVSQNVSLATIGALLSHKSQQTTSRYAHLHHGHISEAGELVAQALMNQLGPNQISQK